MTEPDDEPTPEQVARAAEIREQIAKLRSGQRPSPVSPRDFVEGAARDESSPSEPAPSDEADGG